jgi:eukaryotic-like serine/threonine-protein kinase
MLLPQGTKLGPYEIDAPLGAGGMGEVYRAKDTRLERTVAIKILPAHLSSDPVRKQRFEREAKTISSLNHPHICVLYDVGSQDGVDYLVMECVEGETLAARLEKGPLPQEQVLKYGVQIAEALDKAHRNGVVHRDLKPGNIMLTRGVAKLLDFGLAKPAVPLATLATLTAAAPRPSPVTQEGTIVGTFQYMSPEQVEGKELDGRSDIFSLGAVLYEMLTGKKAFEGKSQLSVASSILEKEPEAIRTVKPLTPPALEHAIGLCLAKNPEERWQTAKDLAQELRWVSESGGQARQGGAGSASLGREKLAWTVAGVLGLLLIATGIFWRPTGSTVHRSFYYAALPVTARDVALAPDGRTAAIVGYSETSRRNVIWIYELGKEGSRSLPDTEGADYPFWSPDGKSIGFFADGKMKKLELSSGQVRTICDAPAGRGGTWNKADVIVFSPYSRQAGLYRVTAAGGTPQAVTQPDPSRRETSHRWPMFLPDGKQFLFMAATFSGYKDVGAIFVGSLDSKKTEFIVAADANAAYAEPGFLLYYRDKTLLAQPFDAQSLTLKGEPVDLLSEIQYVRQVKKVAFAVSNDGLLLAQGGGPGVVGYSQAKWFDRSGKELGELDKPGVYGNVAIAPNDLAVAVDRFDLPSLNNMDIWAYPSWHESTGRRLTFDPGYDGAAVWSPDGSEILFSSNRQVTLDLYIKKADGGQEERNALHDPYDKLANDWSRDGKYILYRHADELQYATLPGFTSNAYLKASGILRNGQFSPDGKWVAYNSNETGKWEIYVTSFPEPHGKWQISTTGGEQPRWRGDGRELFYLSSDGRMMGVPVSTGASFSSGAPVALFQANPAVPVSYLNIFGYAVTRDGQRFLINTVMKPEERIPISVVLNWDVGMKRK